VLLNIDFLIVEDEFLIAETISEILKNRGYKKVRLVATIEEAITEIEICKPNMVLTDINLGNQKSGIDLGELLLNKYQIPFIYITSHSSSEILNKAKYTRPNAYIIKPFKNEDLLVAIEFALFNSMLNLEVNIESSELIVKEGRSIVKLICNDIKWLASEGNYTTINLREGKRRVVRMSLSDFLDQLPSKDFIRIHKSFIVNKIHISEIRTNTIIINKQEIPIGRTYQADVEKFLNK
jgi:DNA-binding LytR/AlgR family response regulator